MTTNYFHDRDIGKVRKINEDTSLAAEVSDDTSPLSRVILIADGMGGHDAGDVASGIVRDIIEKIFVNSKYNEFAHKFEIPTNTNKKVFFKELLNETIYYIHNQLKRRAEKGIMGSTLTVALIFKMKDNSYDVLIGHVGDSRAYKISHKNIKQITEDDSLVWQYYKSGKITKSQMRTYKGKNVILQALGGESLDKVHIYQTKLSRNDILLLSSDGLHGFVGDKKIFQICNSINNLGEISQKLINAANSVGGKDNVSVALFSDRPKITPPPKPKKILLVFSILLFFVIFVTTSLFLFNSTQEQPTTPQPIKPDTNFTEVSQTYAEEMPANSDVNIEVRGIESSWVIGKSKPSVTRTIDIIFSKEGLGKIDLDKISFNLGIDANREKLNYEFNLSSNNTSKFKINRKDDSIILSRQFSFDEAGEKTYNVNFRHDDEVFLKEFIVHVVKKKNRRENWKKPNIDVINPPGLGGILTLKYNNNKKLAAEVTVLSISCKNESAPGFVINSLSKNINNNSNETIKWNSEQRNPTSVQIKFLYNGLNYKEDYKIIK